MKEATGELLSVIVVVISVGVLIAFFYFQIWPMIRTNFEAQTACEKAICNSKPDANGLVDCVLIENGVSRHFQCNYKG